MNKQFFHRAALRVLSLAIGLQATAALPTLVVVAGSAAAQPARATDDELLRKLNEDMDKADKARSEGRGPKHPDLPRQDPCALLTTTEIGAAVKGAGAGQRDRFNEEDGIARCIWKSGNGAPLLTLELRPARGPVEVMGRGRPPGAQFRKLGVGEGGVVYFVPRDPKAGLTRDLAAAGARSGKVDITVSSDELARQGAAPALDALETLLKKAVARL